MLSKIEALTSQYRNLIIQPNGALAIGNQQQNELLISNNFTSEELTQDFSIFCQLPPFLIRTCIFPRGNIVIADRALPFIDYWAIKTINYFNHHPKFMKRDFEQNDNLQLFESLLLLDLQRERFDIIKRETPLGKVIDNATGKLLPCFIYPFLEASVRKACSKLINSDGTIVNVNAFPTKIKALYENRLKKDPNYHVSNIGDELLLLTQASTNPLRVTIDATLKEFASCLNSSKDVYATISEARNGILHGESIGSKGAITAKYIIFLICLSSISKEDYKKELDRIRHYDIFFW